MPASVWHLDLLLKQTRAEYIQYVYHLYRIDKIHTTVTKAKAFIDYGIRIDYETFTLTFEIQIERCNFQLSDKNLHNSAGNA